MSDVEFEAGQRRMVDDRPIGTIISGRANAEYWADTDKNWWSESYLHRLGVLDAPAPKPRQRWQNDDDGDVQIAEADGELAIEDWYDGFVFCRGSVVDVAKWLAERNYRHTSDLRAFSDVRVYVNGELAGYAENVGGTCTFKGPALPTGQHLVSMSINEHVDPARSIRLPDGFFDVASMACHAPRREPDISPMSSLAVAVAEVFAVPTPEQSRRYVDMAICSIRGEPFAKAIGHVLMAMPERCTKSGISPHEIMATIDACRAWEHARGKVAPGKRTLSQEDVGTLIAVAQMAAWARVRARDATGIGAIVGEFYERARATC